MYGGYFLLLLVVSFCMRSGFPKIIGKYLIEKIMNKCNKCIKCFGLSCLNPSAKTIDMSLIFTNETNWKSIVREATILSGREGQGEDEESVGACLQVAFVAFL